MTKQSHLNPDQLYTSEEVTEYLRVSMRTTQRLLKSGRLPSYKVHGQYRVKGLDVLNYLGHVRKDQMLSEADRLPKPADLIALLDVPPVAVEVGVALLPLFEPPEDSPVLTQIESMRKKLIKELGFIFPGIRFKDNIDLPENAYQILLHDLVVEKGQLSPEQNSQEELAEHLLEQLYTFGLKYAHEILSREEVFVIIENLRSKYHVVVEEVLKSESSDSHKLSIGQLTQLLRQLLREQVSIRHMRLILEALADALPTHQNLEQLLELVRQRLARYICFPLAEEQRLRVYTFGKDLEEQLKEQAFQASTFPSHDIHQTLQHFLASLSHEKPPIILTDVKIRKRLARVLNINYPSLVVLSYQEIPVGFKVEIVGEIL